jgi:predicted RNase H-like HicB family nuclease
MRNYEIIIFWNDGDQTLVAEVAQLPGCIAQGDTRELALAHAHETIQPWIDTARHFGDSAPEPKGERLTLA